MTTTPVDFSVEDHGSVTLLRPNTDAAEEWVASEIPANPTRFAGAVVVEPRYLPDILAGIQGDGLTVAGDFLRPVERVKS